jgi:polyhydroxyalkanoate synthesis regulator protein
VNLNDLAALIRKGEEVQVVDAKTGEDITRVVPQIQHRRRQPASG